MSYVQTLIEDTLNRPLKPYEKVVFLDGNKANVTWGNLAITTEKGRLQVVKPREAKVETKSSYKGYQRIVSNYKQCCSRCNKEFNMTTQQVGILDGSNRSVYCSKECRIKAHRERERAKRFGEHM